MALHPDFNQELAEALEKDLFSQAFYRLCSGLDDVDGLVAYGIYKDDKRKALLDRPLRRGDVSFHEIHNHLNEARCNLIKNNAHQRLKKYVDEVIERAKPGIQRDFIKAHIAKQERWQFWKGVGASVTASLAMMILLEFAPWFAEQSPNHLAEMINQRLDKIEAAVAEEVSPYRVEPAAGPPSSELGEGHLLMDDCSAIATPSDDRTCDRER